MYNNSNHQKILEKNLTKSTRDFFDNLSIYVGEPLHFYGSVLRNDFNKKSDIDVSIITSNINSAILKLSNFLQINKKKIKKTIWKIANTNKVIHGYKVLYSNKEKQILVEITIYNEKNKDDVLKEHDKKINIPFYAIILLNILKFFYYDLGLFNYKTMKYYKDYILTYGIGDGEDNFIVV